MKSNNIMAIIIILILFTTPAWATTWFFYDNESGTVGVSLPSNVSGPYRFEYNPPGIYRNDITVSKYAELITNNNQNSYVVEIQNASGTYGTRWSTLSPLTLIAGTTYYIAGKFKFDRISGQNIWQDTTAELADASGSFDKLIEFQGSSFRWAILAGWSDVAHDKCRLSGNQCVGKFTFTTWTGKNSGMSCYEGYDTLEHNVSPYSRSNPYFCDYERWYNIVLGVTAYNSTSGRVQLWINGTKVTDKQNVHTMCSNSATVTRIYLNGTIAQPAYDAPAHKRSFDGLLFTDSWQTLVDLGYLSGSATTTTIADTTPPAAPTGLDIAE